MQRRAAAIYFAVFLLLGAGAFAFIQVGMSQPHVELDGPTYAQGDQLQVGDANFEVTSLEAEASGGGGGGHGGGGGGGITHSGELTAVGGNQTVAFEGGDNVTLANQQYFVHFVSNESVQILPAEEYYAEYQAQLTDIDEWEDRKMGLWAIVFLTFMGGLVLFMSSLMPTKG